MKGMFVLIIKNSDYEENSVLVFKTSQEAVEYMQKYANGYPAILSEILVEWGDIRIIDITG